MGSFELTPLCNLECRMCYVRLSAAQMQGRMLLPGETWEALIDHAVASGMLFARLTGGECLTHPDFWDIYRHLHLKGVEISIQTNGVLLTDEAIARFMQYPPARIQITLYGSNEDQYERVTGRRAFAQVIAAIQRVQAAGIALTVAITPNRDSVEDAVKLLDLAYAMKLHVSVNSALFAARAETGRTLGSYDILPDDYAVFLKHKAQLDGKILEPFCGDGLPSASEDGVETQARGIPCGAGRNTFSIGWDGVMRGCNTFGALSAYPLKDGFAAAWKKLNAMARAYPLPCECEGCALKRSCKRCMSEHAQAADAGHINKAVCAWTRRMLKEGLIPWISE